MRLKLDENLPLALRDVLVAQGHDVHTCLDEGLTGATDPAVGGAATADGRILATCDLDFSDIRLYPPGTHPGIIVFRLSRSDADSCTAAFARLVFHVPGSELTGNVVIVDDHKVRIRRPAPPTP